MAKKDKVQNCEYPYILQVLLLLHGSASPGELKPTPACPPTRVSRALYNSICVKVCFERVKAASLVKAARATLLRFIAIFSS